MSDNGSDWNEVVVWNPAAHDRRRRRDITMLAALSAASAVLVVSIVTMRLGADLRWFVAGWLFAMCVLAVSLRLMARSGPGEVRLFGPPGDRVLDAVARAKTAAENAGRSAQTLTGPAGDEASIGANTLSTVVWQLAELAAQAPASGPGRAAVAAELELRVSALEELATALERSRWESAAQPALATADALVAEAVAGAKRLR